jgi:hypothetical protein
LFSLSRRGLVTSPLTGSCLASVRFIRPLALLGSAFYPILVHRLEASLHASSSHSATLTQLRLASFAVINSRWDFPPHLALDALPIL